MKKIFTFAGLAAIFLGLSFRLETETFSKSNPAAAKSESKTENKFDDYECSGGWRITGYFTPLETDYDSTETRTIEVKNAGKMKFNIEFLNTVFNEKEGFGEGWGKTRFGWYLGNYGGAWHKSNDPLDANNSPLKTNSAAVDNAVIPNDSLVKIPALPGTFGKEIFAANDVGVTVHGKHIDVYTGEGRAAEKMMEGVTFEDDDLTRVCFKKP